MKLPQLIQVCVLLVGSVAVAAPGRVFPGAHWEEATPESQGVMILPSARSAFAYRANERLRLAVVGMAGYGAWQEWIDACKTGGPTT